MSTCAVFDELDQLSRRGMRQDLGVMQKAAKLLGLDQKFFFIVHVAGTNGKGTTSSFLAQILVRNGYKTGLTLSPHVHSFCERIQIGEKETGKIRHITLPELEAVHADIKKRLPTELELTYFEYVILLAMQFFCSQKVDVAVVETGLGGRLDATNVFDGDVAAITTIGMDHTAILGDTREKILAEKIAIVKKGRDLFFGPEDKTLRQQAQKYCDAHDARMHILEEFLNMPPVNLAGYLGRNWQMAIALARLMKKKDFHISEETFVPGDDLVVPPARLQIMQTLPPRQPTTIILDGSHNEEGLKALQVFLAQKYPMGYDLVFGCLRDRDMVSLARIIRGAHDNYWAIFAAPERAPDPQRVQEAALRLGGQVVEINERFVQTLLKKNHQRPVVVCGSFYLCSHFENCFREMDLALKGNL